MAVLRFLIVLLALYTTSSLHAQVNNEAIKSSLILSFNEISLVGSSQEAVYRDLATLCEDKGCDLVEIVEFLPNLPSSNRNLSTFLKRNNYSFDMDLPCDSLATLILSSIEENLLVQSFMQRSEERPARVYHALVKWLNLYKES